MSVCRRRPSRSTSDATRTRTAVVTRSVRTVASATRRSSVATAVRTASVVVRPTATSSAPASRRAGRSRRARATATAATETSARCTLRDRQTRRPLEPIQQHFEQDLVTDRRLDIIAADRPVLRVFRRLLQRRHVGLAVRTSPVQEIAS